MILFHWFATLYISQITPKQIFLYHLKQSKLSPPKIYFYSNFYIYKVSIDLDTDSINKISINAQKWQLL